MRVADFYCGAGGFSEGFRQAGFEITFAVDKWEPAINTYKANKPSCRVIQDDVIRISRLPDNEFHTLVPDTEVIIGSPPCVAFSNSNKSGNGDKSLGIELLKAYLRIVARKKFKTNSILRYWVLENVPNIKKYINEVYSAADLELDGDFSLTPINNSTGIYNAKYFGAPTNRKRFLCGEFPEPQTTNTDINIKTLRTVLDSLGEPCDNEDRVIQDCNYEGFSLPKDELTDHQYLYMLQPFEWKTAKRLKEDKGYMGKMSFPENLDNPARTVMATMSASSRESMILPTEQGGYRLPTVREAASMMSFPIDYRFYGISKGIKHTLVGNAVPPKMSYAIAKSILLDAGEPIPQGYVPIQHDKTIPFLNLNHTKFVSKKEPPKKDIAKFKYHIPYLIIDAFRVELTNYHSDFDNKEFIWNIEIHYSQGKKKARVFCPIINSESWDKRLLGKCDEFIKNTLPHICESYNRFQEIHCMTSEDRATNNHIGPFEMLNLVREHIDKNFDNASLGKTIYLSDELPNLPIAIGVGYYLLNKLLTPMIPKG